MTLGLLEDLHCSKKFASITAGKGSHLPSMRSGWQPSAAMAHEAVFHQNHFDLAQSLTHKTSQHGQIKITNLNAELTPDNDFLAFFDSLIPKSMNRTYLIKHHQSLKQLQIKNAFEFLSFMMTISGLH